MAGAKVTPGTRESGMRRRPKLAMNLETLVPRPPRDDSCVPGLSEPSVPIRKRIVLAADDEEGIRCFSSLVLAVFGFDVSVASDGEQALGALAHEHYET